MADLVLGLAKSAVEGTLTAAKSAIEEEKKLKKTMQRDLMLISDEFEMMRSFLNVSKDRATDEMARTLVRQVRNMALDVEDCIESVVLMGDIKSDRWRRLLPSCILAAAPAESLDAAVSAIELLKSRVEAMGQRNERYIHVVGDSGGPNPKPPTADDKTHRQLVADAMARGILIEARDAKKKSSSPRDLTELVSKIHHVLPLQVISLWGAAGDHGVASIIKKTFDDPEICRQFSCRAWVKLMHPFNPQEFIRSLTAQFYTNYSGPQQGSMGERFLKLLLMKSSADFLKPADVMVAPEGILIDKFMKLVGNQRYLIFLDDVSSMVDWEAVRMYLPDKKNGSCIVVHTQQLEIASLCVEQSHRVLELEQFSDDHSVCALFNEKRSSTTGLMELINMKDNVYSPLQQVISVCGEVGKLEAQMADINQLISRTCDDDNPEICNKHFRYRAWVKLMHPFDPIKFIQKLLAQLCANYCPRHGSARDFLKLKGVLEMVTQVKYMEEFVKQVMSNQRYLIFLEAVSSKDDWDAVRKYLPYKTNGSCIVVHTQDPKVASLCVGEPRRELELLLSADHTVRVFFREGEDENAIKREEEARKWLQEHPLVDRGTDIEFIGTNNDPGLLCVSGIAGVGKSSIVKHVYFKKVIDKKRPFEKFGWVDVSHPFNLWDFIWSLLLELQSGQHSSMSRIRDPIQECSEILKRHACLIVIDGLQSTEDWDSIKAALPFEHVENRSRIIVITSQQNVAPYCRPHKWWTVEVLEIEDALDLFEKTAAKQSQSVWPSGPKPSPSDIERAKSILHKCGGLPKVIVAVADYMAAGSIFHNDFFMQTLEYKFGSGSLISLFAWVNSYFNSCPDLLKPCIFYLCIFPVNHKIRRRRLVRRWIAEGYSMDTKESSAEEKGDESFYHLLDHSMIQVPGSTSLSHLTRMPSCKANGFFREYIKSRSMEENLVFALEGHCSVNSQRTGRHLTIESTWDRDKSVYQSMEFSRLRSLTVFGKWEPFFISDKMRILRVLDLEDATSVTDGDLEQMVKLLPRLKFLSLRGCREITRLPDSFGGMKQLQTLDIRHTCVVTLPICITKLQKLQHIRAGTTVQPLDDDSTSTTVQSPPPAAAEAGSLTTRPRATATLVSSQLLRRLLPAELCTRRCGQRLSGFRNGGVEAPRGIGKMMALHNISVIDVSVASGRAILEELKNLTQLRKLGVSGVRQDNSMELCSAISGHAHLKSFSVWLDKDQAAGCLDAVSPPPKHLQSLQLYGCLDKLPAWIKLLLNLKKLEVQMGMVRQDDVDLLMHLPSLSFLCLCSKEFQYGELRFTSAFRRLTVLEIVCNRRLQSVTFQDSHVMQQLEVLKIRCCKVASLEFFGLHQLSKLMEVSLSGSYDDKVKQQLNTQLAKHQREIKPVLKVEPGSS